MATLSNQSFPSVLHRSPEEDIHHLQQQSQQVGHPSSSSSGLKTYEDHFAELQRRSQAHSNDHNTSTLYSTNNNNNNNKMMAMSAAQQHPSIDTNTPNQPNWQDDQEQFLRNLLSSSIDESASYNSQSPLQNQNFTQQHQQQQGSVSGDEMGRYNSLSPVSSSGYQSLHDFIHGGSISGSSAGGGSAAGYGGNLPTPPDMDVTNSVQGLQNTQMKSNNAISTHQQFDFGNPPPPQQAGMMDAGAINFFVNTITNQSPSQQQAHPTSVMPSSNGIPQHILAQHMAMNGKNGFVPSMNMNGMLDGNTQMSLNLFAPPEAQQVQQYHQAQQQGAAPVHGNFADGMFDQRNQILQQQQQQQLFNESRKRSAPTQATSNGNMFDQQPQHQQGMPSTSRMNTKRARKVSDEQINFQQQQQSQQPQPIPQQQQQQPSSQPRSTQSMMFGGNVNNGFPNASSFMPRMEVGSNATALAAIERLKAKKRAEQEMKARVEAVGDGDQNGKFGPNGMMNGKGGHGENGVGGSGPMMKHEKKVAHNAIERRYRNNINARIAALRNAVPALRELRPKRPTRRGKEAPPEDLVDGVPAATKLNKATILGKATEYIRYLKGRETRLVSEVAGLRELIRSLEGGEELLELWQGEMERVVAEQEAIAHAAFALDDYNLDMMGDEEDEDDEEGDEMEQKVISRSPTSSNGSSSSRYMMGLFMGFSIFGGGSEIYQNHSHLTNPNTPTNTAAGHAHNVLRASSGRVIGASHQLLKRGMQATNVKIGSLAHEPHHFDHVPHHLLIVEVLRGVSLIACLAFIFWPIITHFLSNDQIENKKRRNSSKSKRFAANIIQEDETMIAVERKEMLLVLTNRKSTPHQTDRAMRKFVKAPRGAVSSLVSLFTLSLHELNTRIGLMKRKNRSHDEERAAIWCRLLELETSLGPLAQRSLLARLHTLLNVISSPFVGFGTRSNSPLLHPARVYGTLAIAVSRASNSNSILNPIAERYWTMAKRCRLLESNENEMNEKNEGFDELSSDRWLDPVLELSLNEAISLCPAPVKVSSFFSPQSDQITRSTMISPLLCIAASQHNKQLTTIWSTLLCQIAKVTCPSSGFAAAAATKSEEVQIRSPTCADFVKHHSGVKITLPLLNDLKDRERFTSQITRLTLTAPRCPRLQMICNVTFGTWALLLGNVSVAKNVALSIVQVKKQEEHLMELPACAKAFVKLVLDEGSQENVLNKLFEEDDDESSERSSTKDEVDALAAATLSWLSFLRVFSLHLSDDPKPQGISKDGSKIAQSTVQIRQLLASARAVRPTSTQSTLFDQDQTFSQKQIKENNDLLNEHRDSLASTLSTSHSSVIGSEDEGMMKASLISSSSAVQNQRLIATATLQAAVQQRNLDDALDLLTDILSVLGKRAALGGEFSKEKLLQFDENSDSGVEWNL